MSEETGWKCRNCGNFNIRTDVCSSCGKNKSFVPNKTSQTAALRGLESLVATTLNIIRPQIQPSERIIGCLRGTYYKGETGAFILLDNRLLYVDPNLYGNKVYSIEYLEIKRVEVEERHPRLFSPGMLTLSVDTTYRWPDNNVWLSTKWSEREYTMYFADALRVKVREARTPSLKVDAREVTPVKLTEELEHLVDLRQRGVLNEEEFEAAKKKLLS